MDCRMELSIVRSFLFGQPLNRLAPTVFPEERTDELDEKTDLQLSNMMTAFNTYHEPATGPLVINIKDEPGEELAEDLNSFLAWSTIWVESDSDELDCPPAGLDRPLVDRLRFNGLQAGFNASIRAQMRRSSMWPTINWSLFACNMNIASIVVYAICLKLTF